MRSWDVPGYTEVRALGSGGFGDVVLARHDASGSLVAIKYLRGELLDDPEFARMFRDEARVLASLDDPNVVRLYEYVESPSGAAIVMELIDGISLREILSRYGKTTAEAALVVLQGSLLGLAAAHARGVVHRDYKPENVLVDGAGVSKLTDFGIAARAGDRPIPAGTLAYAPLEQFGGDPASPAGDVYAATATFYECLVGRPPFIGGTAEALLNQHLSEPVPLEPVPEPLRPLVAAGMAKEPVGRPADAAAFVAQLRAAARPAYGQDWEDRGRSHLGEAALLLAALWPSGAASAVQGHAVEQVHLTRGPEQPRNPHLGHPGHPGQAQPGLPGQAQPGPGQPGQAQPGQPGQGQPGQPHPGQPWQPGQGHPGYGEHPSPTRLQRLVRDASRSRRLPRWLRRALPHNPSAGTAVAVTAGAAATVITIVVAVAAIAITLTANSSSATAGSVCSFVVQHTTSCESTNSKVQVYGYFIGNTSACTFVRDIDWGDGTKSDNVIIPGGPAGPKYEDSHTYSKPGSYAIYLGGYVRGNCTIATPTFHFMISN
jgi:serine/threonine protein kinase